jgi:hypothetical protein
MDLSEFLKQAGFHQVPLQHSGVGHFHAAGTLNGRPVSVLIDTGASGTLIHLDLARELDLELQPLDCKGGGAGGAEIPVYCAPDAVLELVGVSPRPEKLIVMDLGHVNQALRSRGENPVEVILGVDVLDARSAIIDYGSNSLFLK